MIRLHQKYFTRISEKKKYQSKNVYMQIVKKRKRLQEKCWKKAGMSAFFIIGKCVQKHVMNFVESAIVIAKRKWYNLTKIYEKYTYYMIFGGFKREIYIVGAIF